MDILHDKTGADAELLMLTMTLINKVSFNEEVLLLNCKITRTP